MIKPYHSKKAPFAVYEQNLIEDKAIYAKTYGQPNAEESDTPPETKIQKKIRLLEESEKLKYYSVDEYKVGTDTQNSDSGLTSSI